MVISVNIIFGAWDNGYILYACLYAVLFYDFTAGLANGIDRSGRFSVGKYYSTAVFSEKIFIFIGVISIFLYAECSLSDIQWRSCWRRGISVYLKTGLLAGDINAFGDCPMETGGKKNHNTRRLIP